jgi:multicomponent K+:H+ antiporter subunit A
VIEQPPQQRVVARAPGTDLMQPREAFDEAREEASGGYLLVPAVLVRLLLPIMLLVALQLFLRGHNQPGGGFVAGLTVAIAFITQYMVSGTQWVEDRLNVRPPAWMSVGLLLAVLTGIGSLVFGYPLLTTHTAHFTLPVLGELHLPSATFFDLGVFSVVLGSTLLLLTALAHQSLRARRRPPGGPA